jgi:uncharacterized protein YjlB
MQALSENCRVPNSGGAQAMSSYQQLTVRFDRNGYTVIWDDGVTPSHPQHSHYPNIHANEAHAKRAASEILASMSQRYEKIK